MKHNGNAQPFFSHHKKQIQQPRFTIDNTHEKIIKNIVLKLKSFSRTINSSIVSRQGHDQVQVSITK